MEWQNSVLPKMLRNLEVLLIRRQILINNNKVLDSKCHIYLNINPSKVEKKSGEISSSLHQTEFP